MRFITKRSLVAVGAAGALVCLFSMSSPLSSPARADAPAKVDFKKDIQPIFQQSCAKCHHVDPDHPEHKPKSGFRVDDKAAFFKGGESGKDVIPGKAQDSTLYHLLQGPYTPPGNDEIEGMPLKHKGHPFKPLSKDKIELIKAWINQGAVWPD
jgi:hypothetical protein